jgi:FtsP/CotA-like multicopper oxidase with cupredoxin domain
MSRTPGSGSSRLSRRTALVAAIGGGGALAAGAAGLAAMPSSAAVATHSAPRLREYWLQADSFWHNAVPNGTDHMMDIDYPAKAVSFWAIGFRAYAPQWKKLLHGDDQIGANTGIPGPTIRAAVGDTVRIHFRNNDSHYKFPHSLHAHGMRYAVGSDGAYIATEPHRPGTAVPYGQTYTYEYTVPASSVGTWPYHDHSVAQQIKKSSSGTQPSVNHGNDAMPGMAMGNGDAVMELNAQLGMLGVVAITDQYTAPVDKEFILVFHDAYADDIPSIAQDLDMFNGHAFLDNTPTFTAKVGERVRWRIVALGKEFHVFHLHAHRWSDGVRFVDSQVLGPSTSLTVEYTEDNPGDWLYHCHVTDHMMGGMVGRYNVTG